MIKIIIEDITDIDCFYHKELSFEMKDENDKYIASCKLAYSKYSLTNDEMAASIDCNPFYDNVRDFLNSSECEDMFGKKYCILEDFVSNQRGAGSLLLGLICEFIDEYFDECLLSLPSDSCYEVDSEYFYSSLNDLKSFYGQASFKEINKQILIRKR